MKRSTTVLVCASLLAAVSCSGPRVPVDIGVKEIDTDVLIGPRSTGTPIPPSSAPPVGFPGIVQPPFPRFPEPDPSPTPVACPTASPLDPVVRPAASSPHAPPTPTGYSYRNSGRYRIGSRSGPYPSRTTRLIGEGIQDASGGFSFTVAIGQPDGSTTTTTYRVHPPTTDATKPAGGLYIERVVTTRGESSQSFVPTPSLLVIPFPAGVGAFWEARGIDPLAQTLVEYTGKVAGRAIVDACGKRLEAWRVELTAGVVRSPTSSLTFTATIDIAPQYGAISIADHVTIDGSDDGVETSIDNTARITEEPLVP